MNSSIVWIVLLFIALIVLVIVAIWWAVGVVLEMFLHRPPNFWEQLAVTILVLLIGGIRININIKER